MRQRLLSLLLALLMLAAASITVHKTLCGHSLEHDTESAEISPVLTDTIDTTPDGTIIINTTGLPGSTDGYAGSVPLKIYISDDKIDHVEALPNAESPAFFKRAARLLSSWDGLTPDEATALKVDAVSGATYSSDAIISNLHVGLDYYEGHESRRSGEMPVKAWIALAVTLAACILPLFVRNKSYHTIQMIANVVVLGFWCGQFLDYSLILKYLSDGISLPAGLVAIAMLTAAFIYPVFGRPQHYCTHICPLGSAQQLVGQICHYKIHIPVKVIKGLDWFRKILWALLMLLLWADVLTGWMDLELFQAFQFQSASWGIIVAAAIFVALSAIVSRPYCRFVCPTGSLFKRAENLG